MNIEITTSSNNNEATILSNGIVDFNTSKVPDLEPIESEIKFFVFAKDKTQNVIGGIRAICFWNTLHIELFWISEKHRGKGIGKKLIKSAESFAIENNCEKAFVETTSWQAKPFDEKNGYNLMGTLNNRPKGHSSHYLTK